MTEETKEKYLAFGELITLETKEKFQPYFDANPNRSASTGFASWYMWGEQRWMIIEDMLVVAGIGWFGYEYEGPFIYTPLTLDGTYDPAHLRRVIQEADDRLRDEVHGFRIYGVPTDMLPLYEEALGKRGQSLEMRGSWDYIYRRSDLEHLKGRKYSKKRNHLNYFYRNTEFEYEDIRQEHVPELLESLDHFRRRKEEEDATSDMIKEEIRTIKKVLPDLEALGFFGGLIRIDGKVRAFTLAHLHTSDMVEAVVEKADANIRGLYQAINREFVASLPPEIEYVNREEDVNIEGLRRAKESYYPCCMFEVHGMIVEEA